MQLSKEAVIYLLILLGMIQQLGLAASVLIEEYKHRDCRYTFHHQGLSWDAANAVCAFNNRTLAKLSDQSEHELISSLLSNQVNQILTASTAIESMWIGLRGITFSAMSPQYFWAGCEQHISDPAFNPWINPDDRNSAGCVLFETQGLKYRMKSCSEEYPFVCEDQNDGPAACLKERSIPNERDLEVYEIVTVNDIKQCASKCHEVYSNCVGIQHSQVSCRIFTLKPGYGAGTGRDPFYPHEIIDWQQYPNIQSTIAPQEVCSQSATPSLTVVMDTSLTSLYQSSLYSTPLLTSVSSKVDSSPSVIGSASPCYCPCTSVSNVTYTEEELDAKIKDIKAKLIVDTRKTAKYLRTLKSAPDDRLSARNIGAVGVVILCVVVIMLIAFDIPRAVHHTASMVKEMSKKDNAVT